MQHELGLGLSGDDRIRFLSANADRVEEFGYFKPFGAEEIDSFKTELSEVSIEASDVEEEKKDVTAVLNDRLKSLKKRSKTILKNLRDKAQYVDERCYMFFDHDGRKVGYYNGEGTLVHVRTMRPDELQKTTFSVNRTIESERTGTDD